MHRNGLLACLVWFTSFAALPPAHAAEPDWQMVGETGTYSVWVDVASLQKEGNVVKTWTKIEYKGPTPIFASSKENQLSVRRREYFDCLAHSSALKSATSFSESNLKGDVVVKSSDAGQMKWKETAPGTVADAILEFACARAPKQ